MGGEHANSRPSTFLQDALEPHDAGKLGTSKRLEQDHLFVRLDSVKSGVPVDGDARMAVEGGENLARRLVTRHNVGGEADMGCGC